MSQTCSCSSNIERDFKKYNELISCFLDAEQNKKLLMKNHESRPTETKLSPKAKVVNFNHGRGHSRGRGRGRGKDYGRGRNNY